MKSLVLWIVALRAFTGGLFAQDMTGNWQGTLQGPRDLRIVLKISKLEDGGWKAVLYSIDQGAQGMAANAFAIQGSNVKMSVASIGGAYEGKLNTDGTSMSGTWTQGPGSRPLNLQRATAETAWKIPDPPARLKPMAADATPAFEVATIKPSSPDAQGRRFSGRNRHFSTLNTTLNDLISYAYGVQARQITGGPSWMETEKYDLAAEPEGEGEPSAKQWRIMLQKLMADRFQLTFHRDKKELPVYAIVLGKNVPMLTRSEGDPDHLGSLIFPRPGVLPGRNATIAEFADVMQRAVMDRPVLDQTGLSGRFDFTLTWTPDQSQFVSLGRLPPPPADDAAAAPDLFTAIEQQMGLKLEATKAPAEVLVIDHVEKPSAN